MKEILPSHLYHVYYLNYQEPYKYLKHHKQGRNISYISGKLGNVVHWYESRKGLTQIKLRQYRNLTINNLVTIMQ